MWLLKNGDQLVLQTADGVMHKVNIVLNTEHEIKELKNNVLEFIITNCSRDYVLSND